MNNYLYVINDMVFKNDEHKYNGKARAIAYCKRHKLDQASIVTLRNDTELAYYQRLKAREEQGEITNVATHQPYMLINGFENSNGENILPLLVDMPFQYLEKGKYHYELVVEKVNDLTASLIYGKALFDYHYKDKGAYLKLLYVSDSGEFVEWKLEDINNVRKMFKSQSHKAILAQHKKIRDQQAYNRLIKLRDEGRISVNQRKELYRLEGILNANHT